MLSNLYKALLKHPLPLHDEKELHQEIANLLSAEKISYIKEFRLDTNNIPDFFLTDEGVAVEVKIKGSKRSIYSQCERYCQFPQVQKLLLVTNKSMGFPPEINGKDCFIVNIGKAWL